MSTNPRTRPKRLRTGHVGFFRLVLKQPGFWHLLEVALRAIVRAVS